jgi:hypothetical protein
MVVYAIDRYYLVISFLITLGWQMLGFFIAWTLQVRVVLECQEGEHWD